MMASITSRGTDTWEVAVCDRGSRTSKRVHGSYADALAVAAAMETRAGKQPDARGITLDAYFSRTFMPGRADLHPATLANYETLWRCHVSPVFGGCPLAEPPHADVQAWALSMPRGTATHSVKLLRSVLRDAWYAGLIPSEPMSRPIRYRRDGCGKLDVWDAGEAADALSRLHGHRLEPLVAVMLGGGLRRSEALALSWEDVSFADGMVRLAVVRGGNSGATKNAQSVRAVSIGEPFASVLLRCRSTGRICPLEADGVRSLWKRLFHVGQPLADVRYIPMKQLRATNTTLMHEAGVPDTTLSMVHGHADVRTDYRHYIAPTSAAADAAARMLSEHVRRSAVRERSEQATEQARDLRFLWSGGLDSNQRPLDPQSRWRFV